MVYGKARSKNEHQNDMGYNKIGSCTHNVLIILGSKIVNIIRKGTLCDHLILKGHRVSIYGQIHNLHMPHQVHKSYVMYLWLWNLNLHIDLCQGENQYIYTYLTSAIQIQHVYLHPRGIQATHFNYNLQ